MSDDNLAPAAEPPTPNFEEHEGDRYLYVGAVSEEQQKHGQAVGNVLQYRYLGEKDGVLALEQVTEDGRLIGKLHCQRDCRIMKFTSGDYISRIPFGGDSIAGAAMADAINGLLEPVKTPPPPVMTKRIPPQFFGTWQSDVSECGTGLDAKVVSVAGGVLSFYESSLQVSSVEVLSPTRVKVTGPLTDEENTTQAMTYTLNLSVGRLTVNDDAVQRLRCPNRSAALE